jgi:hypothetical protein
LEEVTKAVDDEWVGRPGSERADHLRADRKILADHTILEQKKLSGAQDMRDEKAERRK